MSKVTIQFADNQTGKNADVDINPNGHSQSVASILTGTSLATVGSITSVQLLANRQNVTVVIKNNNKEIATAVGNNKNDAEFARTPIEKMTIEPTKSS